MALAQAEVIVLPALPLILVAAVAAVLVLIVAPRLDDLARALEQVTIPVLSALTRLLAGAFRSVAGRIRSAFVGAARALVDFFARATDLITTPLRAVVEATEALTARLRVLVRAQIPAIVRELRGLATLLNQAVAQLYARILATAQELIRRINEATSGVLAYVRANIALPLAREIARLRDLVVGRLIPEVWRGIRDLAQALERELARVWAGIRDAVGTLGRTLGERIAALARALALTRSLVLAIADELYVPLRGCVATLRDLCGFWGLLRRLVEGLIAGSLGFSFAVVLARTLAESATALEDELERFFRR